MQKFSSTLIAIIAFIAITNVRADFTEFGLTVHSSPAIDIEKVDVTPMPIIQPGEAFLTMHANLKRPISKFHLLIKQKILIALFSYLY